MTKKEKLFSIELHTDDKSKYIRSRELFKRLKVIVARLNYLEIPLDKYQIQLEDESNTFYIAKDYDQPIPTSKDLNIIKVLWKSIIINYYNKSQLKEF